MEISCLQLKLSWINSKSVSISIQFKHINFGPLVTEHSKFETTKVHKCTAKPKIFGSVSD